jgi:hypothetical protein
MRALMSTICGLAAGGLLAMSAQAAMADSNILVDGTSNTVIVGETGTLRSSNWDNSLKTASDPATVYDGVFAPEHQQWNDGSFWWDADTPNNLAGPPVSLTLNLKGWYSIDKFTIQADDNDEYIVQYWTGSIWKNAWDLLPVGGVGLTTSSTAVPTFETDALRILGGPDSDKYYAVSELQAFGAAVPEPATWAMMLLGVGVIGAGLRMQRRTTLATA